MEVKSEADGPKHASWTVKQNNEDRVFRLIWELLWRWSVLCPETEGREGLEGVPTGTGLSEWIAGLGHSSDLPTRDNISLSLTLLGSDMMEDIKQTQACREDGSRVVYTCTRLATFVGPSV